MAEHVVKEMYINESAGHTRLAIVENGRLVELYVERPDHQRMVGSIYKGVVENVIPGMQAAFVDIGYSLVAPLSDFAGLIAPICLIASVCWFPRLFDQNSKVQNSRHLRSSNG